MGKRAVNATRRSHRFDHEAGEVLPFRHKTSLQKSMDTPLANIRHPLECLTEAQGHYLLAMKSHDVTFGLGPAGTGKSFVAVGHACQMLMDKNICRIIVTRPMVGVSKSMGYLPGEMEDKFAPFFKPVRDIMDYFLGHSHVDCLIRSEKIQIQPLEFVRGLSWDNSAVLMDEAQNATKEEMMAFLTRVGQYSTVVINGDLEQTDVKGVNGLADAVQRFAKHKAFATCEFTEDDIVRSALVKDVILAYRT